MLLFLHSRAKHESSLHQSVNLNRLLSKAFRYLLWYTHVRTSDEFMRAVK